MAGGSRTHTSPGHSRIPLPLWVRPQYPRQESNLHDLRLRRAACVRHTPGIRISTPARSRTWASTFGELRDVRFTTRASRSGGWGRTSIDGFRARRPTVRRPRKESVAREGVEPSRPWARPSEDRVSARSTTWLSLLAEGEGVEPSRLAARPGSSRMPSPVGLPFRAALDIDKTTIPPKGSRPCRR